MSEFITPPHEFINHDLPTVFLAGPVQGAPDWQTDMARKLLRSGFAMNVASPRRTEDDMANFDIEAQINWEQDHIKQAIHLGVVVINFVAQDFSIPYPDGRSYSQTTRWEAGGAILGLDYYGGQGHIIMRYDPDYRGGNEAYGRIIAKRNNIPVVAEEAELIARVLSVLPPTTRPIPF